MSLTACQTTQNGLTLDKGEELTGGIERPYPLNPEDLFLQTLRAEYLNLAKFEANERGNIKNSEYFQAKVDAIDSGIRVLPQKPKMNRIPASVKSDLVAAYEKLNDAIQTMLIQENKVLLAVAQTRYDCWLAHQTAYPKNDIEFGCKDDFYTALKKMRIPDYFLRNHSVYFNVNETEIPEEAIAIIHEIGERYAPRQHWTVLIESYADAVGNREYNKILALRRAIAVKNALGQHGVSLDNIVISADVAKAISTNGIDAQNRRVDISFKPDYLTKDAVKDISETAEWTHIGG